MTRTLSSLALLLAIALGIAPSPTPRTAPEPVSGAGTDDVAAAPRGVPEVLSLPALLGAPVSFPGSDPARHRGDGGSIPRAVSAGAPTPTGSVGTALLGGWISWADPDLGGDYLATRFPRGTLVRLCTPNRCIVRRSNDFGPSAKIDPPRIADLAVLDWESLCGLPRARGVCRGTVEAIDDLPLPATDTEAP